MVPECTETLLYKAVYLSLKRRKGGVDLRLVRMKEWLEVVYIKVRGPSGLRHGKVKQEEGFDSVVEGDPE